MVRDWHGLGDISGLERKAAERMAGDAATIAHMTMKVVNDLKYLNGCVVRGRGEDIDSAHPGRNVFEYIKELEQRDAKLSEMQGIAQNALAEVERLTAFVVDARDNWDCDTTGHEEFKTHRPAQCRRCQAVKLLSAKAQP